VNDKSGLFYVASLLPSETRLAAPLVTSRWLRDVQSESQFIGKRNRGKESKSFILQVNELEVTVA
jgi:hypothetical protein